MGSEDSVAKVQGPGFVFANLFTTKLYKVDIQDKEKNTDVMAISKPENRKIKIQTHWAYRIVDPAKAILIASLDTALEGLAIVALREIIQDMSIESLQAEQLNIEAKWCDRLNDLVCNKWGIKVLRVELQKITRVTLEIV